MRSISFYTTYTERIKVTEKPSLRTSELDIVSCQGGRDESDESRESIDRKAAPRREEGVKFDRECEAKGSESEKNVVVVIVVTILIVTRLCFGLFEVLC